MLGGGNRRRAERRDKRKRERKLREKTGQMVREVMVRKQKKNGKR